MRELAPFGHCRLASFLLPLPLTRRILSPLPQMVTKSSSSSAPELSAPEHAPSKKAPPPVLYSFANPDELSKGLASFVLAAQDEALKKGSTFKLAVSGGSLPKVLGQDLIEIGRAHV